MKKNNKLNEKISENNDEMIPINNSRNKQKKSEFREYLQRKKIRKILLVLSILLCIVSIVYLFMFQNYSYTSLVFLGFLLSGFLINPIINYGLHKVKFYYKDSKEIIISFSLVIGISILAIINLNNPINLHKEHKLSDWVVENDYRYKYCTECGCIIEKETLNEIKETEPPIVTISPDSTNKPMETETVDNNVEQENILNNQNENNNENDNEQNMLTEHN